MPKLIFLGTSNAISDEEHANTSLVLISQSRRILIDCGENPLNKLETLGVDYQNLTDLILTHFHPDHVAGVPQLLTNMWLLGRQDPLQIHGLKYTLDRIKTMMDLFGWSEWPGFYPVEFHDLPANEKMTVLDSEEVVLYSSPVRHMIQCIGLRMEFPQVNKVVAFSCDTEACDEVVRLAENSDILIHEASGSFLGHSSASQAGEIATQAKARSLYLIHYPTRPDVSAALISAAQEKYFGPVDLAKDLDVLEF